METTDRNQIIRNNYNNNNKLFNNIKDALVNTNDQDNDNSKKNQPNIDDTVNNLFNFNEDTAISEDDQLLKILQDTKGSSANQNTTNNEETNESNLPITDPINSIEEADKRKVQEVEDQKTNQGIVDGSLLSNSNSGIRKTISETLQNQQQAKIRESFRTSAQSIGDAQKNSAIETQITTKYDTESAIADIEYRDRAITEQTELTKQGARFNASLDLILASYKSIGDFYELKAERHFEELAQNPNITPESLNNLKYQHKILSLIPKLNTEHLGTIFNLLKQEKEADINAAKQRSKLRLAAQLANKKSQLELEKQIQLDKYAYVSDNFSQSFNQLIERNAMSNFVTYDWSNMNVTTQGFIDEFVKGVGDLAIDFPKSVYYAFIADEASQRQYYRRKYNENRVDNTRLSILSLDEMLENNDIGGVLSLSAKTLGRSLPEMTIDMVTLGGPRIIVTRLITGGIGRGLRMAANDMLKAELARAASRGLTEQQIKANMASYIANSNKAAFLAKMEKYGANIEDAMVNSLLRKGIGGDAAVALYNGATSVASKMFKLPGVGLGVGLNMLARADGFRFSKYENLVRNGMSESKAYDESALSLKEYAGVGAWSVFNMLSLDIMFGPLIKKFGGIGLTEALLQKSFGGVKNAAIRGLLTVGTTTLEEGFAEGFQGIIEEYIAHNHPDIIDQFDAWAAFKENSILGGLAGGILGGVIHSAKGIYNSAKTIKKHEQEKVENNQLTAQKLQNNGVYNYSEEDILRNKAKINQRIEQEKTKYQNMINLSEEQKTNYVNNLNYLQQELEKLHDHVPQELAKTLNSILISDQTLEQDIQGVLANAEVDITSYNDNLRNNKNTASDISTELSLELQSKQVEELLNDQEFKEEIKQEQQKLLFNRKNKQIDPTSINFRNLQDLETTGLDILESEIANELKYLKDQKKTTPEENQQNITAKERQLLAKLFAVRTTRNKIRTYNQNSNIGFTDNINSLYNKFTLEETLLTNLLRSSLIKNKTQDEIAEIYNNLWNNSVDSVENFEQKIDELKETIKSENELEAKTNREQNSQSRTSNQITQTENSQDTSNNTRSTQSDSTTRNNTRNNTTSSAFASSPQSKRSAQNLYNKVKDKTEKSKQKKEGTTISSAMPAQSNQQSTQKSNNKITETEEYKSAKSKIDFLSKPINEIKTIEKESQTTNSNVSLFNKLQNLIKNISFIGDTGKRIIKAMSILELQYNRAKDLGFSDEILSNKYVFFMSLEQDIFNALTHEERVALLTEAFSDSSGNLIVSELNIETYANNWSKLNKLLDPYKAQIDQNGNITEGIVVSLSDIEKFTKTNKASEIKQSTNNKTYVIKYSFINQLSENLTKEATIYEMLETLDKEGKNKYNIIDTIFNKFFRSTNDTKTTLSNLNKEFGFADFDKFLKELSLVLHKEILERYGIDFPNLKNIVNKNNNTINSELFKQFKDAILSKEINDLLKSKYSLEREIAIKKVLRKQLTEFLRKQIDEYIIEDVKEQQQIKQLNDALYEETAKKAQQEANKYFNIFDKSQNVQTNIFTTLYQRVRRNLRNNNLYNGMASLAELIFKRNEQESKSELINQFIAQLHATQIAVENNLKELSKLNISSKERAEYLQDLENKLQQQTKDINKKMKFLLEKTKLTKDDKQKLVNELIKFHGTLHTFKITNIYLHENVKARARAELEMGKSANPLRSLGFVLTQIDTLFKNVLSKFIVLDETQRTNILNGIEVVDKHLVNTIETMLIELETLGESSNIEIENWYYDINSNSIKSYKLKFDRVKILRKKYMFSMFGITPDAIKQLTLEIINLAVDTKGIVKNNLDTFIQHSEAILSKKEKYTIAAYKRFSDSLAHMIKNNALETNEGIQIGFSTILELIYRLDDQFGVSFRQLIEINKNINEINKKIDKELKEHGVSPLHQKLHKERTDLQVKYNTILTQIKGDEKNNYSNQHPLYTRFRDILDIALKNEKDYPKTINISNIMDTLQKDVEQIIEEKSSLIEVCVLGALEQLLISQGQSSQITNLEFQEESIIKIDIRSFIANTRKQVMNLLSSSEIPEVITNQELDNVIGSIGIIALQNLVMYNIDEALPTRSKSNNNRSTHTLLGNASYSSPIRVSWISNINNNELLPREGLETIATKYLIVNSSLFGLLRSTKQQLLDSETTSSGWSYPLTNNENIPLLPDSSKKPNLFNRFANYAAKIGFTVKSEQAKFVREKLGLSFDTGGFSLIVANKYKAIKDGFQAAYNEYQASILDNLDQPEVFNQTQDTFIKMFEELIFSVEMKLPSGAVVYYTLEGELRQNIAKLIGFNKENYKNSALPKNLNTEIDIYKNLVRNTLTAMFIAECNQTDIELKNKKQNNSNSVETIQSLILNRLLLNSQNKKVYDNSQSTDLNNLNIDNYELITALMELSEYIADAPFKEGQKFYYPMKPGNTGRSYVGLDFLLLSEDEFNKVDSQLLSESDHLRLSTYSGTSNKMLRGLISNGNSINKDTNIDKLTPQQKEKRILDKNTSTEVQNGYDYKKISKLKGAIRFLLGVDFDKFTEVELAPNGKTPITVLSFVEELMRIKNITNNVEYMAAKQELDPYMKYIEDFVNTEINNGNIESPILTMNLLDLIKNFYENQNAYLDIKDIPIKMDGAQTGFGATTQTVAEFLDEPIKEMGSLISEENKNNERKDAYRYVVYGLIQLSTLRKLPLKLQVFADYIAQYGATSSKARSLMKKFAQPVMYSAAFGTGVIAGINELLDSDLKTIFNQISWTNVIEKNPETNQIIRSQTMSWRDLIKKDKATLTKNDVKSFIRTLFNNPELSNDLEYLTTNEELLDKMADIFYARIDSLYAAANNSTKFMYLVESILDSYIANQQDKKLISDFLKEPVLDKSSKVLNSLAKSLLKANSKRRTTLVKDKNGNLIKNKKNIPLIKKSKETYGYTLTPEIAKDLGFKKAKKYMSFKNPLSIIALSKTNVALNEKLDNFFNTAPENYSKTRAEILLDNNLSNYHGAIITEFEQTIKPLFIQNIKSIGDIQSHVVYNKNYAFLADLFIGLANNRTEFANYVKLFADSYSSTMTNGEMFYIPFMQSRRILDTVNNLQQQVINNVIMNALITANNGELFKQLQVYFDIQTDISGNLILKWKKTINKNNIGADLGTKLNTLETTVNKVIKESLENLVIDIPTGLIEDGQPLNLQMKITNSPKGGKKAQQSDRKLGLVRFGSDGAISVNTEYNIFNKNKDGTYTIGSNLYSYRLSLNNIEISTYDVTPLYGQLIEAVCLHSLLKAFPDNIHITAYDSIIIDGDVAEEAALLWNTVLSKFTEANVIGSMIESYTKMLQPIQENIQKNLNINMYSSYHVYSVEKFSNKRNISDAIVISTDPVKNPNWKEQLAKYKNNKNYKIEGIINKSSNNIWALKYDKMKKSLEQSVNSYRALITELNELEQKLLESINNHNQNSTAIAEQVDNMFIAGINTAAPIYFNKQDNNVSLQGRIERIKAFKQSLEFAINKIESIFNSNAPLNPVSKKYQISSQKIDISSYENVNTQSLKSQEATSNLLSKLESHDIAHILVDENGNIVSEEEYYSENTEGVAYFLTNNTQETIDAEVFNSEINEHNNTLEATKKSSINLSQTNNIHNVDLNSIDSTTLHDLSDEKLVELVSELSEEQFYKLYDKVNESQQTRIIEALEASTESTTSESTTFNNTSTEQEIINQNQQTQYTNSKLNVNFASATNTDVAIIDSNQNTTQSESIVNNEEINDNSDINQNSQVNNFGESNYSSEQNTNDTQDKNQTSYSATNETTSIYEMETDINLLTKDTPAQGVNALYDEIDANLDPNDVQGQNVFGVIKNGVNNMFGKVRFFKVKEGTTNKAFAGVTSTNKYGRDTAKIIVSENASINANPDKKLTKKQRQNIAMHESVHAITDTAIGFADINSEIRSIVEKILNIKQQVKEKLLERYGTKAEVEKAMGWAEGVFDYIFENEELGLDDIREFMAYMLGTNQVAREFLASITIDNKSKIAESAEQTQSNNLLDKLINFLKQILGIFSKQLDNDIIGQQGDIALIGLLQELSDWNGAYTKAYAVQNGVTATEDLGQELDEKVSAILNQLKGEAYQNAKFVLWAENYSKVYNGRLNWQPLRGLLTLSKLPFSDMARANSIVFISQFTYMFDKFKNDKIANIGRTIRNVALDLGMPIVTSQFAAKNMELISQVIALKNYSQGLGETYRKNSTIEVAKLFKQYNIRQTKETEELLGEIIQFYRLNDFIRLAQGEYNQEQIEEDLNDFMTLLLNDVDSEDFKNIEHKIVQQLFNSFLTKVKTQDSKDKITPIKPIYKIVNGEKIPLTGSELRRIYNVLRNAAQYELAEGKIYGRNSSGFNNYESIIEYIATDSSITGIKDGYLDTESFFENFASESKVSLGQNIKKLSSVYALKHLKIHQPKLVKKLSEFVGPQNSNQRKLLSDLMVYSKTIENNNINKALYANQSRALYSEFQTGLKFNPNIDVLRVFDYKEYETNYKLGYKTLLYNSETNEYDITNTKLTEEQFTNLSKDKRYVSGLLMRREAIVNYSKDTSHLIYDFTSKGRKIGYKKEFKNEDLEKAPGALTKKQYEQMITKKQEQRGKLMRLFASKEQVTRQDMEYHKHKFYEDNIVLSGDPRSNSLRYMMNKSTIKKIYKGDMRISEMIGESAANGEINKTHFEIKKQLLNGIISANINLQQEQNNILLDRRNRITLFSLHEEKTQAGFPRIITKASKDISVDELHSLLTIEGIAYLKKLAIKHGLDKIVITKDMYEIMKQQMSTGEAIKQQKWLRNNIPTVYRMLQFTKFILSKLITELKANIIIRNKDVLFSNAASNTISLIAFGLKPSEIIKYNREGLYELLRYQKLVKNRIAFGGQLAQAYREQNHQKAKELEEKIKYLETTMRNSEVRELLQSGFYTNIMEDANTSMPDVMAINKGLDKLGLTGSTREIVKFGLSVGLFTPDSPEYKLGEFVNNFSDYMSRYALYRHSLKTMNKSQAKQKALDTFINYNKPFMTPIFRWLEFVGVTGFLRYRLGIQGPLIKSMIDNPIPAFSVLAAQTMILPQGMTLFGSFLEIFPNSIWKSFKNPLSIQDPLARGSIWSKILNNPDDVSDVLPTNMIEQLGSNLMSLVK